ncbi:MAG: hypothetical protein WAQ27_06060 [Candidatus Microsaccharimonas sp.]
MNPQQQLPPSYLDEIAPQATKTSFLANKTRLFIFIGLIAIIIVVILGVTVSAISSSKKEPWERLAARIAATKEITQSSEGKIKNSQLRSINSNVKISITNTERDLAAPLLTAEVKAAKLSPSVLASESSAAMLTRLEDARLNAKYDSTYAREMSYQLSNLLTLLRQLYTSSSNASNKAFLETTYNNFEPFQKSLAEFSASNE